MLDTETVTDVCVALLIPGELSGPPEAAGLVRAALARRGLPGWQRMELDIFPSGRSTLILARPADELHIEVAEWLIPYTRR